MNSSVRDENGNIYYIAGKLSSGGQGCVFTVQDNDSVVIKAIVNEATLDIISDEAKYAEYQARVRRVMSVGEFDNLAMPYVMLEKPLCGYVMLFMSGLQPVDKLMLPYIYKHKVENEEEDKIYIPKSYSGKENRVLAKSEEEFIFAYNQSGGLVKRLKCLAKLAKIMGELEDHNAVYCDLSPNNVFISKDVNSHEVWLIDLDNLSLASQIRSPIGTPKYMAPEVVKGQPNSIFSDRYSFALLAYQLLMMKDPFLGAAANEFDSWEDDSESDDAFDVAVANGEVAWVWEKNDSSNRPEGGLDPNALLTEDILLLFEETFNADGRNNPRKRPSMWRWYDALIKAVESSSETVFKYGEDAFSELRTNADNKYYRQRIGFVTAVEPFKKSKTINRLMVNICGITSIEDESGYFENIVVPDKTIFWDADKETPAYYLSNYDVLNERREKYIPEYITITRKERLFSKSTEFVVSCPYSDCEVSVVENDKSVAMITNLQNVTLFVKYKGKPIKKISIGKE